jgi:hypothetical protein
MTQLTTRSWGWWATTAALLVIGMAPYLCGSDVPRWLVEEGFGAPRVMEWEHALALALFFARLCAMALDQVTRDRREERAEARRGQDWRGGAQ